MLATHEAIARGLAEELKLPSGRELVALCTASGYAQWHVGVYYDNTQHNSRLLMSLCSDYIELYIGDKDVVVQYEDPVMIDTIQAILDRSDL